MEFLKKLSQKVRNQLHGDSGASSQSSSRSESPSPFHPLPERSRSVNTPPQGVSAGLSHDHDASYGFAYQSIGFDSLPAALLTGTGAPASYTGDSRNRFCRVLNTPTSGATGSVAQTPLPGVNLEEDLLAAPQYTSTWRYHLDPFECIELSSFRPPGTLSDSPSASAHAPDAGVGVGVGPSEIYSAFRICGHLFVAAELGHGGYGTFTSCDHCSDYIWGIYGACQRCLCTLYPRARDVDRAKKIHFSPARKIKIFCSFRPLPESMYSTIN